MSETGSPEAVSLRGVQELIAKKDEIEAQIKAYYDVLEDQKNVGMEGPLIDREGFPRADLDIYQVRTARHNIICLQNDHKSIMKEIEEALHNLHAREKRQEDEVKAEVLQQNQTLPSAFARVDAVTPGSPASMCGLQVGDEIIAFGSVNTNNFQTLQNIATVVQHSEGKPLSVTVVRDGKSVHLGLTPQRWNGKGLLGEFCGSLIAVPDYVCKAARGIRANRCNIVPIKR